MYGAKLLNQLLLELEVDTIFGYPGGAVFPVYDTPAAIGAAVAFLN